MAAGPGAADSKLAAAMFCHIGADLMPRAASIHSRLAVLLDVDEHTGGFGGARAYLADGAAARHSATREWTRWSSVDGACGGLPSPCTGPPGIPGRAGSVVGAISRAAHLVRLLDDADLPKVGRASGFPLPPKVSVTSIHGGQGFTVTPDRWEVNVDVRTTPVFDAQEAEALVRKAVAELDAELPAPRPTEISPVASWPPFRLAEDEQPPAALLRAATKARVTVHAKTAGPSNIGNLLAGEGISATAGFGLPYEGLHGIDERAHLAELPLVYAIYHQAVLDLLQAA